MKRFLSSSLTKLPFALLLLSCGLFGSQTVRAQFPAPFVTPQTLYRFQVPSANTGFLLTANYQEGVNLGYIPAGNVGGIVLPPAPGWTPAPGQGLVPMYRWRVRHRAGTNYYYSAAISPDILNNPENTFEGLAGYGLLPSTQYGTDFNTAVLHLWYSQTNGYWYASNFSMTVPTPRPNPSFNYQGVAYRLPQPVIPGPIVNCDPRANCFVFNPPPPPNTCDGAQEQACYNNGGTWNSNTCTCTLAPPDPCRQAKDETSTDSGLRPIMPCGYRSSPQ